MTQDAIVHAFHQGSARRTPFGYMTDEHPTLDRIQNSVSAGCGLISGAAIIMIAVITLVEIFTRAVFDAPLGWSVSLIEQFLLPTTAFFGIVTAYRSGAHVAVVSVFEKMSTPVRKALLLMGYVIVLLGMVAVGYTGLLATLFSFQTGEGPMPGSSELLIPSWIFRAIIPTSMGLGAIVVVIDLWRELSAPWNTVATDYDPGDEVDAIIAEVAGAEGAPSSGEIASAESNSSDANLAGAANVSLDRPSTKPEFTK